MRLWVCASFFFFQAEDGIRDKLVTGVQTCALPISTALAALSQTVASCPARRNARDSVARVLASSSTISRLAFTVSPQLDYSNTRTLRRRQFVAVRGQLDDKRCTPARLAAQADSPAMVADNGLHDSQAESCT